MQYLYKRHSHFALNHGRRIVVWSGIDTGTYITNIDIVIYDPLNLSWTNHRTTGEIPPDHTVSTVQIIRDKMYVFFGTDWSTGIDDDDKDVHVLDLNSLVWRKLEAEVEGKRVQPRNGCMTSWLYDEEEIVVFGYPAQLSVYDTRSNVWRRQPTCGGRYDPDAADTSPHSVFVVGSKAYVFDVEEELYRLDMDTWTWEAMVLDPSSGSPGRRRGHSLTVLLGLPCPKMLLYGGLVKDNGALPSNGNCWMLHLDGGLSYRWERCNHLDKGPRFNHRAVVEAATGQVWLIAGSDSWNATCKFKTILKLTVTRPLSLTFLVFKVMAEEREGRLKKGIANLPKILKDRFNNYVSRKFVEDSMQPNCLV